MRKGPMRKALEAAAVAMGKNAAGLSFASADLVYDFPVPPSDVEMYMGAVDAVNSLREKPAVALQKVGSDVYRLHYSNLQAFADYFIVIGVCMANKGGSL